MTDPNYYPDYDYDYHETQTEIYEEVAEYNLNAAHANDEGWFYADNDDGELPNSDFYD